ncbi:MAG: PAS domain-containing protein [Acidobacteria bacterium]|nr:PAS domain-containing protein [Acidobacteriota bacterium]
MQQRKPIPIRQRLNFRITCGLLLALLVVGVPFFAFFYHLHKHQLIDSLKASSTSLGQLVLSSLEGRMLEKKPHLIGPDVNQLSAQSGVQRIMILNIKGETRISSDPRMQGKVFARTEPSCVVCHDHSSTARRYTTIVENGSGGEVFRSIILIDNKPQCFACHLPEQRVNGILLMDLSMAEAKQQLASGMQKMLGLGAIMVLVTIVALGASMDKLILQRIKAFTKTTVAIRSGNLDERVEVREADEISELARSFNIMTAGLKESLREVERQKEYLENVINSIEDEIIVVDRQSCIVTANKAFLKSCARRKEEILGQTCALVSQASMIPCHQDLMEKCPAQETFWKGVVKKTLHRFIDQQGHEKYVEIHSYPLRDETGQVFQAIEVRRDITERRFLEAILSHSERLASLGLLASGLSHEINNPLASITACTEGLKRKIRAGPSENGSLDVEELGEYIELIHKEAMRAKAITDRLLILSRKSESPTYLVSISQSLSETISLLRFQAEEREIQIIEDLDPHVPPIKADDPALRQVFLNLLLNAMQAIDRDGRITVQTKVEQDLVKITFEDTGCGMAREDLGRLFEPFFSRKASGRGTGLGLFISHILIRQMGGTITVQSEVGKGTQFVITLPLDESRRSNLV